MSPLLIGALVFVVVALGGFVRLTDRTVPTQLTDHDAARVRFCDDFPDANVSEVEHTDDGQAALLWLAEGNVGVVVVRGDRQVTRRLGAGTLRSVAVLPAGIRLRTRDFSLPWIDLPLADEGVRERWAERLQGVAGGVRGRA